MWNKFFLTRLLTRASESLLNSSGRLGWWQSVLISLSLFIKALILGLFSDKHLTFRFDISRLKQLQLGAEYPVSHVHLHLAIEKFQTKSSKWEKLIVTSFADRSHNPEAISGSVWSLKILSSIIRARYLGCSLTCWEWSSSFCSPRSIPRAPFPAPAARPGRWWSGRLATCPCLEYLYLSISIWVLVFEY